MHVPGDQITAGILAGGQGRRLGGIDKGWYRLDGQPLIERTIERVRPQAGQLVISANRSLAQYHVLGYPVQTDASDTYRGPLAGIATVLEMAATPLVLIVPVDTPRLPLDLAARLATGMDLYTDIVIARTPGRVHPLHALLRRSIQNDLRAALASGVRGVGEWQKQIRRAIVDWSSDECFANINTIADADALIGRR